VAGTKERPKVEILFIVFIGMVRRFVFGDIFSYKIVHQFVGNRRAKPDLCFDNHFDCAGHFINSHHLCKK
jgi:hypothetical protein